MADHKPSSNKLRKQALREKRGRKAARALEEAPVDPEALARAKLRASRHATRNPLDTMQRMAAGEEFTLPRLTFLNLVQEILREARLRQVPVEALTLVHACLGTSLLADNLGPERERIKSAFVHLATRHGAWIRRPHDWRPARRNRRRQLSELIRHLVASYDVPRFFDEAWTLPLTQDHKRKARRTQGWFLHVAGGGNLRTAPDLPVELSKRIAHHTLEADAHLHIGEAIRFGQGRALGLDAPLAGAFAETRAGDVMEAPGGPEASPFWESVLRFFAGHGMVDPGCIGPSVDYLIHQRFVPVRQRDGTMRPTQPNLTMRGRTLAGLLDQVEAWHGHMSRVERAHGRTWPPLGRLVTREDDGRPRGRFTHRAGSKRQPITFFVEELLSGNDLAREGRALSHCVHSYAWSCERGRSSIWSLRRVREDLEERLVTIEIRPASSQIVQVRGPRNRTPTAGEWKVLDLFAHAAELTVPGHIRACVST